MTKTRVAVVRKLDKEGLHDTIRRAVDMIGGFPSYVKKGDRVVVKPNLVGGDPVPGTMIEEME